MLINWLILAISAYFLSAFVSVVDKILVSKKIPDPIVYSLYIGFLSLTVLVFVPFGFSFPPFLTLLTALLSGFVFLFGLIFLFSALKKGEASRVFTTVGGLTPIFLFLLSFVFLNERLSLSELSAFAFLLIGGLLINLDKRESGKRWGELKWAFLTSLLFAFCFFLTKLVFLKQPFFNGFIWIRLGSFLAALLLLSSKKIRKRAFEMAKKTKTKISLVFIANKGLAGFSFILLNLAIFRGSLTLINSLQGVQYGFIFLLSLIFSYKFPQLLEEKISLVVLVQKIFAIALITWGLLLLWLY